MGSAFSAPGDDAGLQAQVLVSVLIASHNHAPYIARCLDSLLTEGHGALELLLIDDGSDDDTPAIAERWVARHGSRFAGGVWIGRQANRGVVPTLNELIRRSRGAFFIPLASDDYLLRGGIAARLAHLARRPDHLAVFGDAVGIDQEGLPLCASVLDHHGVSRAALRWDRGRALEIIIKWSVPGPVLLARRCMVDRIGWYDERYRFEDRAYYLRLAAAHAIGYVDIPVAAYRMARRNHSQRYRALEEEFHQIETELVDEFRGLERWALAAVAARYVRRASPRRMQRLRQKLLDWLLRRLRRLNRLTARLALGASALRRPEGR